MTNRDTCPKCRAYKPEPSHLCSNAECPYRQVVVVVDRGAGRTTAAMLGAPPNAFYVWCNDDLWYPQSLAKNIGRADLKIVGVSYLLRPNAFDGRRDIKVVIDHAVMWDARTAERTAVARLWLRASGMLHDTDKG